LRVEMAAPGATRPEPFWESPAALKCWRQFQIGTFRIAEFKSGKR
jgi:hypothetical protein